MIYKEYKIGDLFIPQTTKWQKKYLIKSKSLTPQISNTGLNNGLKEYVNFEPTEKGNIITYSDTCDLNAMFYQPKDYIGYSHLKKLVPKEEFLIKNRYTFLYVISCIRKSAINKFNYNTKLTDDEMCNIVIKLPYNEEKNQIDFNYMEQYIKEVEEQYIKEVEEQYIKEVDTYLSLLGYKDINDCKLTKEDEDLLNNDPITKEFRLEEIFTIKKSTGINTNKLSKTESRKIAYVTRTSLNNGIHSYTKKIEGIDPNPEKTISIGLLDMTAFYQKTQWYSGQFVRLIEPKFEINEKIAIFFLAYFKKLRPIWKSVLVRDFDETFNETIISLPFDEEKNQIDYNYIENYMRIIEKIKVIKLREHIDRELELLNIVKNNY